MLDVNALSPNGTSGPNLENNNDTEALNVNNSVQNLLNNATGFHNGNESPNNTATATATAVAAAAFNNFINAAHLNSSLFASTSNVGGLSNVLGNNRAGLCSSPLSNSSCNGTFNNNNLLKSNQSLVNHDENGGKNAFFKMILFLVKLEMPTTPSNNNNNNSNTSRSRLMFDPLSELPILERWFEENPHPGWLQIEQFTGITF